MQLENDLHTGITLDQICISLLLFADDAAIFSETAEGLHKSLDNLQTYCDKWNLTVNIVITNIIVFQKGRRSQNYRWTYCGNVIENVNNFNYLGVVLSNGGSFIKASTTLGAKALRAMHSLYGITKRLDVPINIMLNLFDSFVAL